MNRVAVTMLAPAFLVATLLVDDCGASDTKEVTAGRPVRDGGALPVPEQYDITERFQLVMDGVNATQSAPRDDVLESYLFVDIPDSMHAQYPEVTVYVGAYHQIHDDDMRTAHRLVNRAMNDAIRLSRVLELHESVTELEAARYARGIATVYNTAAELYRALAVGSDPAYYASRHRKLYSAKFDDFDNMSEENARIFLMAMSIIFDERCVDWADRIPKEYDFVLFEKVGHARRPLCLDQ